MTQTQLLAAWVIRLRTIRSLMEAGEIVQAITDTDLLAVDVKLAQIFGLPPD